MMKIKFQFQYITCLLAGIIMLVSCKYDNYAPPKSEFTGAIMYKGDTIPVASEQVTFELWQSGFGKMTPINVTIDQDGSFSALLFNGTYKLDFPSGQGPFMSDKIDPKTASDTMIVHVQGNTIQNIEVLPYYMIQSPKFSLNDSTVTATCKLEKIITDANAQNVENVTLYINKTRFVDNNDNIASMTIDGGNITDMNNINLKVKVPDMVPTQHYVFARIGIKIKNVEDRIFSPVVKLNL